MPESGVLKVREKLLRGGTAKCQNGDEQLCPNAAGTGRRRPTPAAGSDNSLPGTWSKTYIYLRRLTSILLGQTPPQSSAICSGEVLLLAVGHWR